MERKIYSVGVWNDNTGASRFGESTRNLTPMLKRIENFAKLGIKGIEAHDNEITSDMVKEVKKCLDDNGLIMSMYTPNLFWDKDYANGALASHDPKIRKKALQQFKKAIDTAHQLEAQVVVYWNGQEGTDIAFGKDGTEALKILRDSFNEILRYDSENYKGKELRLAIEPKPNEPRNHMLLPTVGDAIAFIYTLDKNFIDRVGVNPETAHSLMIGLDYVKDIETALYHNKLFHTHLNDQCGCKYDQDYAFGSVNPKKALELVYVLEKYNYSNAIGFDLSPLRTDSDEKRYSVIKASIENYERLVKICKKIDGSLIEKYRAESDFNGLDLYINSILLKEV